MATTSKNVPQLTALDDDGSGILMLGTQFDKWSLDHDADKQEDVPTGAKTAAPLSERYSVKTMTHDPSKWDEAQYVKQTMSTFHNDWRLHKKDSSSFEQFYNSFDMLHQRWFGKQWKPKWHGTVQSPHDHVRVLATGASFVAVLSLHKQTAEAYQKHAQQVEDQISVAMHTRADDPKSPPSDATDKQKQRWLEVADVHSDTIECVELLTTDSAAASPVIAPSTPETVAALEKTPTCELSFMSWQTSIDASEDRWFSTRRLQCHMPCVAEFINDTRTLVLLSRNRLRIFTKGLPLMKQPAATDMTLPFPPTWIYRMTVNERYIVLYAVQARRFVVIPVATPQEWIQFAAEAIHADLITQGVSCIHVDEQADVVWCGTGEGRLFGVHLPTRKLAYSIKTDATLGIRHIRTQARRIAVAALNKLVIIDQTPGSQGVYFDLDIHGAIDVRFEGNMIFIVLRNRSLCVMNAHTHKIDSMFDIEEFIKKKVPKEWHMWMDDLPQIGFDRARPTRVLVVHPNSSAVSLTLRDAAVAK